MPTMCITGQKGCGIYGPGGDKRILDGTRLQPEWRANTDTRAIVYNYIYGTPQMDASKYVTTKEKRRRSRSRTDGKGNLSGLSGPVGDDTSKRATLVQHNIKQI